MHLFQWGKFITFRLIKFVLLLFSVIILSFILVSNSPVDPIQSYVGADMMLLSPEQKNAIEDYWGLNEPKTHQFLNWGKAVVQGDLGTSLLYRQSVMSVISERFLASLALMGVSWLLSGILGFTLGVISGMYKGTLLDRIIKGYCFILASTPAFWIGILLMMVFSVWLGLLPIGLGGPVGVLADDVTLLDRIKHLILPALTLSIVGVANVALHTRQKLLDIMNSEFIKFSRAKGERGFQLFWRHGLKNALLPAISIHFASFGELFGGAILAEQVFSYPGLGQAVVQAGLSKDVPLLLGIVIFSTLFVYLGNLIADVLYRVIDPRTKGSESV